MQVTSGMDTDLEIGMYRHWTLVSSLTLWPKGIALLIYKLELKEFTSHVAMVFILWFTDCLGHLRKQMKEKAVYHF